MISARNSFSACQVRDDPMVTRGSGKVKRVNGSCESGTPTRPPRPPFGAMRRRRLRTVSAASGRPRDSSRSASGTTVAGYERPARLKCFPVCGVRGMPSHVIRKPLRFVAECTAGIGIDGQLVEIFALEVFQRIGQPAVIEFPRLQGQDQPRGAAVGFDLKQSPRNPLLLTRPSRTRRE